MVAAASAMVAMTAMEAAVSPWVTAKSMGPPPDRLLSSSFSLLPPFLHLGPGPGPGGVAIPGAARRRVWRCAGRD